MATTKAVRMKKAARLSVPQSDTDTGALIGEIGNVSRNIARLQHAMNDEIAEITERYMREIMPAQETLDELHEGVQAWCEAHRDMLTDNGARKTYNFVTGMVQWRQRPPSCSIRGADLVIERLRGAGLGRFIRVREEINKEAVLAEPEAVAGIRGLTITRGVEDFVVEPFEQEVEGV